MNEPQTRPLRVWEVIDVAVAIYRRGFRQLVGVSLALLIPALVVELVGLEPLLRGARRVDLHPNAHLHIAGGPIALMVCAELLSVVIGALVLATLIEVVNDHYVGTPRSIGQAIRSALPKSPRMFGIVLLYTLGLMLGFVLLIIPGIWLLVAWSVAFPVAVIEGLGPARALGRSRELVAGRWWPLAAIFVMVVVVLGLTQGAVNGITDALIRHGSDAPVDDQLLRLLIAGVVSGLVVEPLVICTQTVMYYDMRFRKDGYDPWLGEYVTPPVVQQRVPSLPTRVERPADGDRPYGGGRPLGGDRPVGPEDVGKPGGPPYWPPPPGWQPGH